MSAASKKKVIESTDLSEQPRLDSDVTRGKRFADRVAVVTGGAGGIGSAVVQRFLNDGASVAIVDLNDEAANKLIAQEFKEYGGSVKYYRCDVSVRQNCFDVVAAIVADFGKVNYLFNSVAYFKSAGLGSDDDDWANGMRVNVASNAFMGQACYARMKDLSASEPCSIVNTSSISAHQAQPNRWTYLAAKGAINILTKAMALDMAPGRVRVNSVSPSWIWSPETAKACVGTRAEWEPEVSGPFHILNRMGEMSEVAAAVTFLFSQDAAYINATDLKVDGGYGAMSAEGHGEKSKFGGTAGR